MKALDLNQMMTALVWMNSQYWQIATAQHEEPTAHQKKYREDLARLRQNRAYQEKA